MKRAKNRTFIVSKPTSDFEVDKICQNLMRVGRSEIAPKHRSDVDVPFM